MCHVLGFMMTFHYVCASHHLPQYEDTSAKLCWFFKYLVQSTFQL